MKFDTSFAQFFFNYIFVANRQWDKKAALDEYTKLDIGDRTTRSRCNVSSAPAVFLTRAFMMVDNKSNARRKENRDVILYRTLRVYYGRSCFSTRDGNCVDVFGCFYVYRMWYTSSLRRLLVFYYVTRQASNIRWKISQNYRKIIVIIN